MPCHLPSLTVAAKPRARSLNTVLSFKLSIPLFLAVILPATTVSLHAANVTWSGGNSDWVDGAGNNGNWIPADEPDPDDTAFFISNDSVNMESNNEILGLTLLGGFELHTNGFDLSVAELVLVSGSGTRLVVDGGRSLLDARDLTVNNESIVELQDGSLTVSQRGFLGAGIITINAGGLFSGHGSVSVDAPLLPATVLNNNGTLRALTRSAVIIQPPQRGTLLIAGGNASSRIDLDGSGESGTLAINRNQTLDIDITPSDPFNGTIGLFHNATLDIAAPWTLAAGSVLDVDNGASDGIPGIPASTSTIAGGALTQSGGTFTVVDTDGTLELDVPFTMTGGVFTNNGHVILNQDAVINVADFHFDAGSWTVQNNAQLSLDVDEYDINGFVNTFNSSITLDNSDINVVTGDPEFVMDGVLNMHSSVEGFVTVWNGEPLDIGNDSGALDAQIFVTGSEVSRFGAQVNFNADADISIGADASLEFGDTVNFNTVNGPLDTRFLGAGTVRFHGGVNVNEAISLDMAGGIVDLDGLDDTGDTISIQAPLVINAATLESFGRINPGGGENVITIDALSAGATGSLTVTLDDPDASWTINPEASLAFFSTPAPNTLLAGSDVVLDGTTNVTGTAGLAARLDIGGAVNILTAIPLGGFVLQGGSNDNPNLLLGGTIDGPGELRATSERSLHGFGTINAQIDFDGNANLLARDGTLTITNTITDVAVLGTADETGILEVLLDWSTSGAPGGVIERVVLLGGELRGGTILNNNQEGIRGHGIISARLLNDSQILAMAGNTLIVHTANDDNDWDGPSDNGALMVAPQAVLELHDALPVNFGGDVAVASGGVISLHDFDSDFNSNSSITLEGGIFRSTNTTNIAGAIVVDADSIIDVGVNRFLEFESTCAMALNADLRLINNNITIEAGTAFNGPGSLIITAGSHLIAENGADVDVLLLNQGAFRPSGFSTTGRVDLRDYQETAGSQLLLELAGTALNQFDRLVVNGAAQLAGVLQVELVGGYVPMAGDNFNIISTTAGISGQFASIQHPPNMPAGLSLVPDYSPTVVQLRVMASSSSYEAWIESFASLTDPADREKNADPDEDGLDNFTEFGLDGDPTDGSDVNRVFIKIAPVGGVDHFTMTIPVRDGAVVDPADPAGGELVLLQSADKLRYRIQGSDTLTNHPSTVSEISGPDAAAIQAGLPALHAGWSYRSFRSSGSLASDPAEFMRAGISEGQ